MSLVSVLVVNWNGREFLADCICSVLRQTHREIEIIVVDNGSRDGSVDVVREQFPEVTLIENEENVGFPRALNQAIAASHGSWVLVLNPDTYIDRRFVEEALESTRRDARIGGVSGKILRFDGETVDSTGQFLRRDRRVFERGYSEKDVGRFEREGYVFSVCGAVALYRREMLEDISTSGEYFDEDYFAFYEDLDVGWRANVLGWRCWYNPKAVAHHSRGGTSPSGRGRLWGRYEFVRRPKEIRYHILKNRYMTIAKNDTLASLLADLPVILLRELVLWGWVVLFCPALLLRLPAMWCSTLNAFKKRGVARRRRESVSQIRGWMV